MERHLVVALVHSKARTSPPPFPLFPLNSQIIGLEARKLKFFVLYYYDSVFLVLCTLMNSCDPAKWH